MTISLSPEARSLMLRLSVFPGPAIAAEMDRQNELTIGHIQEQYLSKRGPTTLGVITNRLRSSIRRSDAVISSHTVASSIGSNVDYLGPHEFGAHIGPHTIRAKNKKALSFITKSGQRITVKSVSHPGFTLPARAPLLHGIQDRAHDYSAALSQSIITALTP